VSSEHRPPRVLAGITIVLLSATLACASRGAKDSSPAAEQPADASVANRDGRTIEDLFAGRFPGVSVTRAEGGGLQIRIRGGSNSFYGSSEPLYVVDDTPLAPDSRGIVFLNPYDIEKIEVLKNPADIGLYGIRGANGVIKITTKRPRGR
jgi:TonB-dependent SusC/RagA subfamily outer membrane receptor